ncbi:NADP-dependent oxidoreductase [Chitinophaga cymbidii]|uniref:NADPH:quinone reductase n=1 Tax=Chitinophaga cymbidii TaxID=1096750 RepID=A0A512RSJ0_9BACT|nr:NADP-dependent oxidoreductase [Chitinophaga cymbidii]GEP98667.1 NADPH:quinone reductase [Chitinophaga cymbidii]
MKAVAASSFKAIPALTELPEPVLKPGTVRIRLAAAGLNPFDWKMVDGILKDHMQHVFPLILGVDGAGVVEETAAGVTRFKKGDRVYGQMLHEPVGEGSYAEYVVVPEDAAISLAPESIPLTEAAAVPTAGMTALQMLDRSGLQKGQTLLIVGATGGVGSFAIQLAAARGIHVIATASSPEKAAQVKGYGAAEVIDYKSAPLEEQVKSLYPDGIDGLIDLVSNKETFGRLTALVRKNGAALTTMFVAGVKEQNFETNGTPASLDALSTIIDAGGLQIPIDKKITLGQAAAAIAESRERKSKGKTIIEINDQL